MSNYIYRVCIALLSRHPVAFLYWADNHRRNYLAPATGVLQQLPHVQFLFIQFAEARLELGGALPLQSGAGRPNLRAQIPGELPLKRPLVGQEFLLGHV